MGKAYLEIIRIRFLMMLAYRVNYYSGILIYALNIGSYYFLWKAIYSSHPSLGGLTLVQMTTYVVISWMARAFYFNNIDREIASEIRDGSVAIQFTRPYHYLYFKLFQGLGEGLFRLLLFSIPGMILVSLFFPIQLPHDPMLWLIFLGMIAFSFMINAQINIITGLFAFFFENNEGLLRMKRVTVELCSGLIVPIALFPGWTQTVCEWLPFQAITYLPSSVFAGRVTGIQVWQVWGIQVIWFCVLVLPITMLWGQARKRLYVQGG